MNKGYSPVGRGLPRPDALEKVTGAAKYTADFKLPGMLYGRLVRSPHAHARVVGIDTRRAEGLPGVKAVVTAKEVPGTPFNNAAMSAIILAPYQMTKDQRLFDGVVRFRGEGVAAVAATSAQVAKEAAGLVEVQYQELPAVLDPEEAMQPGAPLVHDGVEGNLLAQVRMGTGNIEEGFAAADHVLEARYVTSRQKQCQMEPSVSIAAFSPEGRLTIWSPTAMPHLVRRMLAELFDLPETKVRVVSLHIGGSFGSRLGLVVEPYAVVLAKKAGLPVMVEYDRQEDFYATESRHPCIIDLKAGARKDGTLCALQAKVTVNTGAYATHGQDVAGLMGLCFRRLYRCPHVRFEGYVVYTNTPVAGAHRGYGGPQAIFALESHMDALAEALGLDPLEFRLKNAVQPGDPDLMTKQPIVSYGLERCLRKGVRAIGWGERVKAPTASSKAKRRGLGMGCFIWVSGVGGSRRVLETSQATIALEERGTVRLYTGASDPGTGSRTTLAQIAAQELGLALEDIEVVMGDTDVTPFDIGSHASRTLYVAGGAVLAAARELKGQVLTLAAEMLEASTTDLELLEGRIQVRGSPDQAVSLAAVAERARSMGVTMVGRASHNPTNAPPFGAQFAEVEVDLETGEVRVLKLVTALDVGRAINPSIVEGQLEGALHHGLGYALTEELLVDRATGRALNPDFHDYRLATAVDMPVIQDIMVETLDPTGPFGAKGVGENGMLPTAAAIANAIYQATGVRMRELPITSEALLRALKAPAR
jgi:xanthine dehydrogenase molybdenum-binding subunit